MNNSIGVVKISDDVITVIAGIAASEIKGVYPLFSNNSNGNCSFIDFISANSYALK